MTGHSDTSMNIAFTGSAAAPNDTELAEFEQRSGLTLPAAYRDFLTRHNGGAPSPKRFTTQDGKVESMVAWFFPLAGEGENSLWHEVEGFTLAGQIPRQILPIARDPADNRIVLSTTGRDAGHVYDWSWDEEPDPATCSRRYMRLIAPDFQAWLNMLR
ncbi:MAG: SMI1/KNR4 family protein [Aquabacterium sp.]|uniref:SMI1/KNR4 family protein n=1 Tax=Aquabacterium sp. TaxID=1872578 RepID=UPI00271F00A6|nr:SMI1/KNR4 family protein [Aquabacterium sp.]MDO9002362.1 SMI1/KNR4 family protein [Aquabacterium sp.]